ncbi:MAG: phage tail sheath protein [Fusobacteriaceae bacterium]
MTDKTTRVITTPEVAEMRQAKATLTNLISTRAIGVGQINPEPVIQVLFRTLARTAIQKSDRGLLYIVLADTKQVEKYVSIKTLGDLDPEKWDIKNYNLIQMAMENYPPSKVIVRTKSEGEALTAVLKELEVKKITHLACPDITTLEDVTVTAWVKSRIGVQDIVYVTSYANNSDACAIIELENKGIYKHKLGDFTAQEYTVALAGAVAGCPLNRSLTNAVLQNLESVEEAEPKNGKLVLKNDDGKVRIVYALNSKTTFDSAWKPATRKIKVYEGMNIVKYDIQNTFRDYWCGLYINNYDNKKAFISNVNKVYFKELAPNVLSPDFENRLAVDFEAQKSFIVLDGLDPDTMSETDIYKYPTGDEVHIDGQVRFSDTMDNLVCQIVM